MRKAIDLAGQRFGRLVAVEDVGTVRSFRAWKFSCDCGEVIVRSGADVRHGKVSSCGCLRSEMISRRTIVDRTGKRFGRLVVIDRSGVTKHGAVVWNCVCDCGQTKAISGNSLGSGTKSCGCLQREAAAARQRAKALPPEEKARRRAANAKRQRAKRKADPLKAMQARLSRLHRLALAQVGAIKTSPTLEQLGYTAGDFVTHIERQFLKGMGWHNMSEWQIDHIVPIAEAKTEDDVVALNQLSNLRPLWATENNAKKARRVSLL